MREDMNEDEKLEPSQARVTLADVAVPQEQEAEEARLKSGPAAPAGHGSTDVQAYIGRQLRAVFDDVARQPVPQRFLDLMAQLEARTGGR